MHRVLFNVGTLSLAGTAAAAFFVVGRLADLGNSFLLLTAVAAALAYYTVNVGLLSLALAVEGRERMVSVWRERFFWLAPHYAAFGFLAGVLAVAYDAVGVIALAVAVLPLLLMRSSQASYLQHTERSAEQLREAAETIHTQNVSLANANRLLRERSTAAMESLSATVDARDAYTAGHSRRVQRIALAIGRELDLSQPELDLLGHAALFHDIGKLAIPDAILMKPAHLDTEEWRLMRQHADEGARIVDRLGFLADAVPAIRHHHEHYDGIGLPRRPRRRGHPARRTHHPRGRRARLDAHLPYLPAGTARGRGARRAPGRRRDAVLPAMCPGARADPPRRFPGGPASPAGSAAVANRLTAENPAVRPVGVGYRAAMDEAEEFAEIEGRFQEAGKRLIVIQEDAETYAAMFVSASIPRVGSSQTVPGYMASSRIEAARLAWAAYVASR